ncbi:MAG: hypothetical protein ACRENI_03235 [Gemmatimonadaceae bacterium]
MSSSRHRVPPGHSLPVDAGREVADAVAQYRNGGDIADLVAHLESVASRTPAAALVEAAEPHRDLPEVTGPLYERIVAERPSDARALVTLASAYWLSGRGPDVVGALAARALESDPANRAAWHLWALTESDPRARTTRWRHVVERFGDDELARANLADNAAALAGAEHDGDALALAIEQYTALRETARHPAQRDSLDAALRTLREWKL